MKGKLTVLLLAMAVVLLAASAGLAANVVLEDKFTTLDPAWGIEPSADVNAKDGKLTITTPIKGETNLLNESNILPNDMEANYTIAFVKAGSPRAGSGLIFWGKDTNTYYALQISNEGGVAVFRELSGRVLMPVAWRQDAAIKQGVGAENQIKLVTKGNQGTIFINGKQVGTFVGEPPEGGSLIGFEVDSGPEGQNTVAFSNFKVLGP